MLLPFTISAALILYSESWGANCDTQKNEIKKRAVKVTFVGFGIIILTFIVFIVLLLVFIMRNH